MDVVLLSPTLCEGKYSTTSMGHTKGSMVRTKQSARLAVYWPAIDNSNIILACKKCQDTLPSNEKEPIISNQNPLDHFRKYLQTSAPTEDKTT